jgi:TetR/AcrR family fatty acid metabolism transcriptional regulator
MAKEALNKIDKRKRERIFRNAAAEFARHGYHKANVNSIARRAGIGKGSIYLYFADKRDLYRSTFLEATRIQNEVFDLIEQMDLAPIARIEKVFEESLSAFPRYRNMFKMYFDLTSAGGENSLSGLAPMLEQRSAEFFRGVLADGIEEGSIRKNLPIEHAAYLIDCVYSLFFATLASKYQSERFRIFTGADISQDTGLVARHMREILHVLETGIGASGPTETPRARAGPTGKRKARTGEKRRNRKRP